LRFGQFFHLSTSLLCLDIVRKNIIPPQSQKDPISNKCSN
jgi:hypothetical protein